MLGTMWVKTVGDIPRNLAKGEYCVEEQCTQFMLQRSDKKTREYDPL